MPDIVRQGPTMSGKARQWARPDSVRLGKTSWGLRGIFLPWYLFILVLPVRHWGGVADIIYVVRGTAPTFGARVCRTRDMLPAMVQMSRSGVTADRVGTLFAFEV